MISDARTLLELSSTDYALLRLKKQLDTLPQRKKLLDLRTKRAEVEKKVLQIEALRSDCEQVIKRLQDEEASLRAKADEVQHKVDETSNYKEVGNLSKEIEGFAKRIEKIEFETLRQLERSDKIAQVEKQVHAALAKLNKQDEELIASFQADGGALQKEMFVAQKLRQTLAESLPAELLERYEKARQAKGGTGAAHLELTHCSGCRVELTDGQLAALKSGPEISECPYCHRLLVVQ
ncbi:MAG: C4-type zinc ribbon domain-containing protein [Coriobacteriales bacterium]|jgi:predicted  nucleic acid-binding Zn-ribbon protein|nr:C4-type zinc ribbon domain-containing protein [Coriobacteriales bacterium]